MYPLAGTESSGIKVTLAVTVLAETVLFERITLIWVELSYLGSIVTPDIVLVPTWAWVSLE